MFTAHAPPRPGFGTQIFGAPQLPEIDSPGTDGEAAPPPPEERTQIYGRNLAQRAEVPPEAPVPAQAFGSAAPSQEPPSRKTQIFGAGLGDGLDADAGRPSERTQVFGRVTAPAGEPLAPADPPWASAHRRAVFAADPGGMVRSSRRRRRKIVFGVLAAILFAGMGWAGLRAWLEHAKGIPPQALAEHSEAVSALRRDDATSLADARARLQAVVQRWPAYFEARATHVMAMIFQLDDARMDLQRLTDESTALNSLINQLTEQRSPSDWEERVSVLVDRLGELKTQIDPAAERAAILDGEVNDAFRALQDKAGIGLSPEDEVHLVRTQALYFGVKGSQEALALSERYRAKGGQDGWGEVAWAEYALNARSAPDTLREAREALDALRAKDPSWVRLYMLIGRLAMGEKALDAAATAFESALTLNPKHQSARSLLHRAEKRKKHAAAEEFIP